MINLAKEVHWGPTATIRSVIWLVLMLSAMVLHSFGLSVTQNAGAVPEHYNG